MDQVDYRSIASKLEKRINNEIYKSGLMIPGENSLAEEFNTSRTIIRKAIDILVEKELIVRKKGVGTFVTPEISTKNLLEMSDIIKSGSQIASDRTVTDIYLRKAFVYYSKMFDIKENELIYSVRYLESGWENNSLSFEKLYFPLDVFPGVTEKDFKLVTIMEFMNSGTSRIKSMEQSLELVKSTEEVSKALKVDSNTDVFKFENHYLSESKELVGIQIRYEVAENSKYIVDFSNKER